MDTVHEETRNGLQIKIYQDENAQSPQEWGDDNLFLTGYHRDFWVDGPCETIPEHLRKVTHKSVCGECYQRNFTTIEETGKTCGKCGKEARYNKTYYETSKGRPLFSKDDCITIAEAGMKHKDYWCFGLEAYIHSGVRLAIRYEGNFPDRGWDVSNVGLVFVSKKEWRLQKKAKEAAASLVNEWNDYLSGDVYGFVIENAEGEEQLSCWGFYGRDRSKTGGILRGVETLNALIEARNEVDSLTNKGTTDERGQILMPFLAAA